MHRVSCVLKYLILQGKGVWGKPWLGIAPDRRLADDGKRLHRRWTLYPDRLFLFKNRVGGLGEERAAGGAGREAGGFIKYQKTVEK